MKTLFRKVETQIRLCVGQNCRPLSFFSKS